jgi:hypothetical protein
MGVRARRAVGAWGGRDRLIGRMFRGSCAMGRLVGMGEELGGHSLGRLAMRLASMLESVQVQGRSQVDGRHCQNAAG